MTISKIDITETYFWKILLVLVKYVMVLCSIAATGVIIYSVVLRYIFKGNFYGSDEIILMFAFWLYFMGAVYGSYENSHIKADLLNVYVKNIRIKDFINLIAQVIMIVVNLILITWAWDYFMWGLEKMPLSTGLKIPLVIPQSAVFFGMLLMAFYHIVHFIRNIYRYINFGYYSLPQDGDYMTAETKAKFPQADVPLKEEIKAMEDAEEKGEGGER
ncbi:MAG: TRAP transporter small permease [Desulfitobacteriaceae bacterium]|nr:TRAP transporter small permease [Desulfitobacteriaceae bacterium]